MPQRNTPLRAIRDKCLECSGGNKQEVQECVIAHCPLYPFRMGVDPQAQGVLPGIVASEGADIPDGRGKADAGDKDGASGGPAGAKPQKQHSLF